MKLAITSSSTEFDAPLEARFGRCIYFIIVDSGTREFRALPNPAADSQHGAGTQAAQFIANQGVGAVISGSFGPNAFSVLESAGVKMSPALTVFMLVFPVESQRTVETVQWWYCAKREVVNNHRYQALVMHRAGRQVDHRFWPNVIVIMVLLGAAEEVADGIGRPGARYAPIGGAGADADDGCRILC